MNQPDAKVDGKKRAAVRFLSAVLGAFYLEDTSFKATARDSTA